MSLPLFLREEPCDVEQRAGIWRRRTCNSVDNHDRNLCPRDSRREGRIRCSSERTIYSVFLYGETRYTVGSQLMVQDLQCLTNLGAEIYSVVDYSVFFLKGLSLQINDEKSPLCSSASKVSGRRS